MSGWLARLKNEKAPDTPATKPTKPPRGDELPGFVGFVAYPLGTFHKNWAGDAETVTPQVPAANDGATPAPAPATDPDRHCWPHTPAMNTLEIEQFKRRLAHFSRMGVSDAEAERLADAWVTEDREGTGRGCCVACSHLSSFSRLRCQRAAAAGVHPELAADFAVPLQKCNAFECHKALGNPKVSQMISEAPEDQEGWP